MKIKKIIILIVGFLMLSLFLVYGFSYFVHIFQISEQKEVIACDKLKKFRNPNYKKGSRIISSGYRQDSLFAHDDEKKIVYRVCPNDLTQDMCAEIKGVDYDTFEVVSVNHAKDKNSAYTQYFYFDTNRKKEDFVINEIDFETFTPLIDDSDNKYSKDKNHVYFGNKAIEGADPETFNVVSVDKCNYECDAKDKNGKYFDGGFVY